MLAAIAKETLQEFMDKYEEKTGEKLSQKQALFLAGFDVNRKIEEQYHMFRSQKEPSKIKNGAVIHGYVRNKVKGLDSKGNVIYTDISHPLSKLYEEHTVVTGDTDFADLISILDVGDYDPSDSRRNKE